jgi:hypothetical protein
VGGSGVGSRGDLGPPRRSEWCPYMYRPGPRTMNQYDPTRMIKNMARARANSRYSVSRVAPTVSVRKRMTAKMAKDIAPVMTTVLSIVL